mmetsp:Transcript_47044/g.138810  ORF Transcript_47044/g.138810 Transcript_47044/m.138810 type:complete len:229 (-) Transcript_47044:38-724(-)
MLASPAAPELPAASARAALPFALPLFARCRSFARRATSCWSGGSMFTALTRMSSGLPASSPTRTGYRSPSLGPSILAAAPLRSLRPTSPSSATQPSSCSRSFSSSSSSSVASMCRGSIPFWLLISLVRLACWYGVSQRRSVVSTPLAVVLALLASASAMSTDSSDGSSTFGSAGNNTPPMLRPWAAAASAASPLSCGSAFIAPGRVPFCPRSDESGADEPDAIVFGTQ